MKECYIIGYPIEHSMSAIMHNTAFNELKLDFRYSLKSVKPEELETFVKKEFRKPVFRGASVTIPHKINIMNYLDHVDMLASEIGAVNTIVNNSGFLEGYNTDGAGGVKALEEVYGKLDNSIIIILGAGGASRALCYTLADKNCTINILNRSQEKATFLAEEIKKKKKLNIHGGNLTEVADLIKDTDILINTTPVGMYPNINESPIKKKNLHPNLLVYDIVYNPIKTRLCKDAEKIGAKILSGEKMLVYQGILAFQMWTGEKVSKEIMLNAVLDELCGIKR